MWTCDLPPPDPRDWLRHAVRNEPAACSDINGIIKKVRLIYTIIETIESAISDFIEDLLRGGAASVAV